jgi:hypothetical protein
MNYVSVEWLVAVVCNRGQLGSFNLRLWMFRFEMKHVMTCTMYWRKERAMKWNMYEVLHSGWVKMGLTWTPNRYYHNTFQGFITNITQRQEISCALKGQCCHRYQCNLLQTKCYVKKKGQSKFCICCRVPVLVCACWTLLRTFWRHCIG